MRQYLLIAALAAGVLGSWTGTLAAQEAAMIELAAPRSAGRGASVELQITTGPLPRGARLTLATEDGESLGAVTPYPPGRQSNTAMVPVPRSAIVEGRLRLRLQVLEPGAPARPPRPNEVQRLDLVVTPRSE
jgi:predicted secreted protein